MSLEIFPNPSTSRLYPVVNTHSRLFIVNKCVKYEIDRVHLLTLTVEPT